MKIVYADVLKQLKILLEEAAKEDGVSHVAISQSDMRTCITHLDMPTIFPNYANERATRDAQYRTQLKQVNGRINGNQLNDIEKNQMFDRQLDLETAIQNLAQAVPSEAVAFNGILVKVSMKA